MNPGRWAGAVAQQSAYEFFEAFFIMAAHRFGPADAERGLAGRLILSCGLGERGGAQPLAATMTGAALLGIDADAQRIKSGFKRGECDFLVTSLDEALRILKNSLRKRENLSVGLVGNSAELLAELAARGVAPDLVTDQTPILDAARGYLPAGMSLAEAQALRERDAGGYEGKAGESIRRHIEALVRLREMGSVLFDSGNGLREAAQRILPDAAPIPDFAREYAPELAREGSLLRWAALSGERLDLDAIDALLLEMFPAKARLGRWIEQARRRIRVQGVPTRIVRLRPEERAALVLAVDAMVREGKLRGAVVFEVQSSADPAVWGECVVADGSAKAAEGLENAARPTKRG